MTQQYKGMRWLKCDLHMQTPVDSQNWTGDTLIPGQESQAAKAFAEACYRSELDVVGITDHNFLSKAFLPHLKTAFDNIERDFSRRITMFPGFEFEADVGKGIHVLCLFEPGEDLDESKIDEIDHILTECGVSKRRIQGGRFAKSTKRLPEILDIVQNTWRGIVIIPHVFEDSLFDNDRISEWLQQEEFLNEDLLAVEVSRPVGQMSEGFRKLFGSGDDCQPEWKRIRPIATLMSSDNKKLIEKDSKERPTPNSIGYRYTWIKMSNPSIESFRQAFLDHDSRIILPEDVISDIPPAKRVKHARIQSISIKGVAFLADQEVCFSPNMNCVIGGRGSGKSTLLEYLRIMFGKDKDDSFDRGTQERINRIRGTLKDAATIEVRWISADGVEDCFVWRNGRLEVLNRDELPDPGTFFGNLPLKFYSQQQLNKLTEAKGDDGINRQAQRLLELVDGFAKNDLDDLGATERKLKSEIQEAFFKLRQANNLEKDMKRLQQERLELDRQWKARSKIQEDARRHQLSKDEARYLEGLLGVAGGQFKDVADLAERIAEAHVSFDVKNSPHESWLQQFDEKVKASKDQLVQTIRQAVDKFYADIDSLKLSDPAWVNIEEEIKQADSKFQQACAEKGLTVDDVGHLQEINQLRVKKQSEIDELKTQIQKLQESAGNPEEKIQELHQVWKDQYQKRTEAANRANELAVLREGGDQRFIEVSAKYQQDQQHFLKLWQGQGLAPSDGRTRLGRSWDVLGGELHKLFVDQPEADSPWQLLQNLVAKNDIPAGNVFSEVWEELSQYIYENQEAWEKLRCCRVRDTVDMKLFRADGTLAGSIAKGSLSDGQRNTAALALLLAQEGGPLIIDQPEDELDSNFVFRELIPMLRKVKIKRQLIMATHNANLPVNGDSELVYAFEARDGHGMVCAQGGLDQNPVTKAVLDIMEGTKEAFRRRQEKYHF